MRKTRTRFSWVWPAYIILFYYPLLLCKRIGFISFQCKSSESLSEVLLFSTWILLVSTVATLSLCSLYNCRMSLRAARARRGFLEPWFFLAGRTARLCSVTADVNLHTGRIGDWWWNSFRTVKIPAIRQVVIPAMSTTTQRLFKQWSTSQATCMVDCNTENSREVQRRGTLEIGC